MVCHILTRNTSKHVLKLTLTLYLGNLKWLLYCMLQWINVRFLSSWLLMYIIQQWTKLILNLKSRCHIALKTRSDTTNQLPYVKQIASLLHHLHANRTRQINERQSCISFCKLFFWSFCKPHYQNNCICMLMTFSPDMLCI